MGQMVPTPFPPSRAAPTRWRSSPSACCSPSSARSPRCTARRCVGGSVCLRPLVSGCLLLSACAAACLCGRPRPCGTASVCPCTLAHTRTRHRHTHRHTSAQPHGHGRTQILTLRCVCTRASPRCAAEIPIRLLESSNPQIIESLNPRILLPNSRKPNPRAPPYHPRDLGRGLGLAGAVL